MNSGYVNADLVLCIDRPPASCAMDAISTLRTNVGASSIPQGLKKSLTNKLTEAGDALFRSQSLESVNGASQQYTLATEILKAFNNEVHANRVKINSSAGSGTAEQWILTASDIISLLLLPIWSIKVTVCDKSSFDVGPLELTLLDQKGNTLDTRGPIKLGPGTCGINVFGGLAAGNYFVSLACVLFNGVKLCHPNLLFFEHVRLPPNAELQFDFTSK